METNDYESDIEFGQWLRDTRTAANLTIEQAAAKSTVAGARIKSLEMGYAERGITKAEAEKLSAVYKISLQDLLARAAGDRS